MDEVKMVANAGDIKVVDFKSDNDNLLGEDAIADADASPTASTPKLRSAITDGASSFDVGDTRKTKGRGFCEEARPDRGNRLATREFDSSPPTVPLPSTAPPPVAYHLLPTALRKTFLSEIHARIAALILLATVVLLFRSLQLNGARVPKSHPPPRPA